jgi:aspartyl-tRNA synthetase
MWLSDEGKPISKKAFKKLQKDKEKAERKAATAAKLASEKAERDANSVVCIEMEGVRDGHMYWFFSLFFPT